MDSAATALPNHQQTMQRMTARAVPMADSSKQANGSASGSASSATITANDFLTLLVTEMQNQDPTANTDPNEYINQLVQVNSLEQLIGINQTLSTALGPSDTTTNQGAQPEAQRAIPKAQTSAAGHSPASPSTPAAPRAFGNLGATVANPSALRVAHALDGSQVAHRGVPVLVQP